MSEALKQGTQEWRDARVGRITGSRVGAVMNLSPFMTRKQVLREMVQEANGFFSDFDSPAMRWGRDHEEEAVKLYTFLYADDLEVKETGFHIKGYLGASPDRLVGDTGLVEIKCPYSLRDDVSPAFKSIMDGDMRHYFHQIQLQLYVTDRRWCHFFQWTPNGYKCEKVMRSENWFPLNRDWFKAFMDEFDILLLQASKGGPEDIAGQSARWVAAAEDYRLACATERQAAIEKANARDVLLQIAQEAGIDRCEGGGVRVQRVVRAGAVDFKKLAYDQLTAEVVDGIAEEYRKAESATWQVNEIKGEQE
jgi:exodeoxyribonuclease (lambda-induced)